jgi:hypothetical protein
MLARIFVLKNPSTFADSVPLILLAFYKHDCCGNKGIVFIQSFVILSLHLGMGENAMKRAVLYLRVSTIDQTTANQ